MVSKELGGALPCSGQNYHLVGTHLRSQIVKEEPFLVLGHIVCGSSQKDKWLVDVAQGAAEVKRSHVVCHQTVKKKKKLYCKLIKNSSFSTEASDHTW